MTALTDLLARVEGASGADRDLDAAIGLALGVRDVLGTGRAAFTASVDAALALMESVLPGSTFAAHGPDEDGKFWAGVGPSHYQAWADAEDISAAFPALAILAATLRALIAKEGEK